MFCMDGNNRFNVSSINIYLSCTVGVRDVGALVCLCVFPVRKGWRSAATRMVRQDFQSSQMKKILSVHAFAFAFFQVQAGAREQSVDRETRRRTLHGIYSEPLSRSDGENVLCRVFLHFCWLTWWYIYFVWQVMFTIDMNFRPENNRERLVTITFGALLIFEFSGTILCVKKLIVGYKYKHLIYYPSFAIFRRRLHRCRSSFILTVNSVHHHSRGAFAANEIFQEESRSS